MRTANWTRRLSRAPQLPVLPPAQRPAIPPGLTPLDDWGAAAFAPRPMNYETGWSCQYDRRTRTVSHCMEWIEPGNWMAFASTPLPPGLDCIYLVPQDRWYCGPADVVAEYRRQMEAAP